MAPQKNRPNPEKQRLLDEHLGRQPWKKWGPYLSEATGLTASDRSLTVIRMGEVRPAGPAGVGGA
jgi:hypothetical protein